MELALDIFKVINDVIIYLFTAALGLNIIYILLCWLKTKKFKEAEKKHRFGLIICARNEQAVIGDLIKSLKKQNYPQELIDIFVVADNCTDDTARLAKDAGAIVFERSNPDPSTHRVSYALQCGFENILKDYDNYDAFIRFDADNFVHADYVNEMNNALAAGVKIGKGYNNSKNLTDNIISCISGLWYIRDNRFNCHTRSALGLSQVLTGSGMMISADIIRENGGWIDMGISEDADFGLRELIKGNKAEYVSTAMVYEDQPTTLRDTFRRNMRMGRGLTKTFFTHGIRSLGKFFTTFKFTYLDMFITELFIPMALVAVIWFPFYYIFTATYFGAIGNLGTFSLFQDSFYSILTTIGFILIVAFAVPFIAQAVLVYFLEKKRIRGNFLQVLPGILLFPLFMVFYALGITLGILTRPKWKQITRSQSVSLESFSNDLGQSFDVEGEVEISKSEVQAAISEDQLIEEVESEGLEVIEEGAVETEEKNADKTEQERIGEEKIGTKI